MVISYFFLQCWMLYSQLNDNESESDNHSVMSDSLWPHGVHGILQARILEWVVIPFSRGTSQPRDRTQVSHIAGRFFISWATRILGWVVYPFSRGSSRPRNRTEVSSIAGGFFTNWATRGKGHPSFWRVRNKILSHQLPLIADDSDILCLLIWETISYFSHVKRRGALSP